MVAPACNKYHRTFFYEIAADGVKIVHQSPGDVRRLYPQAVK
jgi:hypothetical protein